MLHQLLRQHAVRAVLISAAVGCAITGATSNLHGPHAPCLVQTPRACARVAQPSSLQSVLLPPPCFLLCEVVVQPATEHGFFCLPPPCLPQRLNPDALYDAHPSKSHVPRVPCLSQTPRAAARVVQPSSLHSFLQTFALRSQR